MLGFTHFFCCWILTQTKSSIPPPPPPQMLNVRTLTTLRSPFYYCALEYHLTDRLPTFRLPFVIPRKITRLSVIENNYVRTLLTLRCWFCEKGGKKCAKFKQPKTVCLILFLSSQVYKFTPGTHCRQTWWTGTLALSWTAWSDGFKSPYWLDKTKTWSDSFHDAVRIVHDGIANTL